LDRQDDQRAAPFLLAELCRIGPYFALLGEDGKGSGNRWQPVASLVADAQTLSQVIDTVAVRLGGASRWIAASVFYQGWAARLTSVYAGSVALGSAVPDLGIERLQFRLPQAGPADLVATPLVPADLDNGWRRLTDDHLEVLAAAVRQQVRIGSHLLRGNVASALAGSLATLAQAGHGSLELLIRQRWAQPAGLARYGQWIDAAAGPRYRRTTCCGYDQLPHGGRCGDCSLARRR
jgi:hypothetical protein